MAEESEELSPEQRLIEELRHCRVNGQNLGVPLYAIHSSYTSIANQFEGKGNTDMRDYYRMLATAVGTLQESPAIRTMKVKDEEVIDRVIEALPEAKTIDHQLWKDYTYELAKLVFVIPVNDPTSS